MTKIVKPTLLLDERKCRMNIQRMAYKANESNVAFRPHFKTHQSLEIGRWFKAEGVNKITVSSVTMAEYFAREWRDILIAFPLNVLEIEQINKLAAKIKLHLLVESIEAVRFLSQNLTHELGFYIKIDAGYHRTGVDVENYKLIDEILSEAGKSEKLKFTGFLSHAGHTYHAKSVPEIFKIRNDENLAMLQLKARYIGQYPELIASIGDTPSCSLADHFSGIDEIRPGNFVFYDLMQIQLGVCDPEQVAVAMACPVVAIHSERNEVVIYGGGVHFSKDSLQIDSQVVYGQVMEFEKSHWGNPIRGMFVKRLSQEHGIVHVEDQYLEEIQLGDLLYIIPVHSCMTADIYGEFVVLDDNKTPVKTVPRL
jgi:D-serine deaminase-like pyridoxal phosphate-dependent protein